MRPLLLLRRVRRRVLLHRRPLAAVLAALAAWVVVQTSTSPPPPTVPVWTAADDLPGGTVLRDDDLRRTAFAPGSAPAAAIGNPDEVVGRTLAAPVAAGQPLVPGDVVGPGLLAGHPGRVALGLRVTDAQTAALLRPGDRVGLVASDPQGRVEARELTDDAVVLTVPPADAATSLPGRLVLFAVDPGLVASLTASGTSQFLSVVWSH